MRNTVCKATIDKFRQRFNSKQYSGSNPKVLLPIEPANHFPYKIALSLDRNNNTSLTIERRNLSQSLSKDHSRIESRHEPPSRPISLITQVGFLPHKNHTADAKSRAGGSDYLLNSLKILRMTENFLPPLMVPNIKPERLEKNIEDLLVKRATSNDPLRYFNAEMQEEGQEASIQRSDRNKLRSIKRNHSPSAEVQVSLQAEERLIEWLGKIRSVKDMERKKAMCLRDD